MNNRVTITKTSQGLSIPNIPPDLALDNKENPGTTGEGGSLHGSIFSTLPPVRLGSEYTIERQTHRETAWE